MPALRILLLSLCLLPGMAASAEIRVAVAANFAPTLRELAEDFTADTGHGVLISSGSTGKHYAQIRNGAGFDIFLAADSRHPELLEAEGVGVAESRFTYAVGRLALWVPGEPGLGSPEEYLRTADFTRLAIANPRLAPYGLAAQQTLEIWQLWDRLQPRLVRGENIAQTHQFVATGNAPAGLVALSHLRAGGEPDGTFRLIPDSLHQPISQQALLLRPGEAAEAFLHYLRGGAATGLIQAAGYQVPVDR
ncbi:MAG: molybdate ABC transporter substrate-binding protein [Sedimenticolaceae bacterium]